MIYSPGNSKYEGGSFWPINNPDIISYDAEVMRKKKQNWVNVIRLQA